MVSATVSGVIASKPKSPTDTPFWLKGVPRLNLASEVDLRGNLIREPGILVRYTTGVS